MSERRPDAAEQVHVNFFAKTCQESNVFSELMGSGPRSFTLSDVKAEKQGIVLTVASLLCVHGWAWASVSPL